jgi:dUTP pyrophosphatase|nr:MAG TPA: dUTPase [Caudoviricetes sp.]
MRYFEVVKDEFRKNSGDIKLPTRSTEHSSGYDFYSPVDVVIQPHEMVMIWSDIKANMYWDNTLLIVPRSSMGKQPIMIANTIGVIDSDYYNNESNDGNIGFRLLNLGTTPYEIKRGDRIGQGIFVKYGLVNGDNTTTKRNAGFGSTGV